MDDPQIDRFSSDFAQIEMRAAPETLFHYTSNDTLLNVIKNKSLWMTHALFMNDSVEFIHGMNKFKKALDVLEKRGVEKSWLDRIREFFDKEMASPLAAPYVFSLTEEPDQLSQWRGYGDFGFGVSIGMNANQISQLTELHLKILPVIYDHDLQDKIINSVLDGFIKLIQEMGSKLDDGKKYGPALALGFFQVAYVHSIRFKDKSWHEEREWRAVVVAAEGNPKVFSRTRNKALVKTYGLGLPNLEKLLSRVVIGPCADKKTQRLALETVRASGDFSFEIGESSIPMRP